MVCSLKGFILFQHTAARRRLDCTCNITSTSIPFQHTAARRRLVVYGRCVVFGTCFNTQPPEGGWSSALRFEFISCCFNTQPPEGGWVDEFLIQQHNQVSTHSRPKAAGLSRQRIGQLYNCFNTQPPEGGWVFRLIFAAVRQWFQHTAARRRLVVQTGYPRFF